MCACILRMCSELYIIHEHAVAPPLRRQPFQSDEKPADNAPRKSLHCLAAGEVDAECRRQRLAVAIDKISFWLHRRRNLEALLLEI